MRLKKRWLGTAQALVLAVGIIGWPTPAATAGGPTTAMPSSGWAMFDGEAVPVLVASAERTAPLGGGLRARGSLVPPPAVPTIRGWGMISMIALLAIAGLFWLRRISASR